MTIELLLGKEVVRLQKKHNFNPSGGIKQVKGSPDEVVRDFGAFQTLLKLAKKLSITLDVPYDPVAIGEFRTHVAQRERKVYFAQASNSNRWKIGCSIHPHTRVKEVQVGNDLDLMIRFDVSGGFKVERAIHKYLARYKVRSEWFEMDHSVIVTLIQRINSEGYEFLTKKE